MNMIDILPPAPYPADTRAKGWRFELDYEAIEQSDTWALAAEVPMAQHALVMMWLAAWRQTPCGSLPGDENLVRVACRVPAAMWAEIREILMRGWWPAADGRIYHDTLVKRVGEMMGKRRSDSDRQATKRAKESADTARLAPESDASHAGVTRDTAVTPTEVTRESDTDNRQPNTKKRNPPHPRKRGSGARFDEFWLAWPKSERKQDKAKCLDHWQLHELDDRADVIVADVRVKRGTQKWKENFVEAPLTYLRGKRWEDGVTPDPAPPAPLPARTGSFFDKPGPHGPVTVPSRAADDTTAYLAQLEKDRQEALASRGKRAPIKAPTRETAS